MDWRSYPGRAELQHLAGAVRFLTRIPIPYGNAELSAVRAQQVPWYGLVGLAIGALLALSGLGLAGLGLPPPVTALVVLLAWIAVTGGLHLDGLADCGDGWMSGKTGAALLSVIKDTRCGVGALLWVVGVLLAKWVLLWLLVEAQAWSAVLYAAALARLWVIVCILRFAYVGGTGLGAALRQLPIGPAMLVINGAIGLLLLAISPAALLAALVFSACGLALVWVAVGRKLNGFTGDVYGAVVEVTEAMILLGILLLPSVGVAYG